MNKMKKLLFLSLSFFLALFFFVSPAPARAVDTSIPQVYWGGYLSGKQYGTSYGTAPWDTNTWNLFEKNTNKKVSILSFSTPWYHANGWPNGYVPFLPTLFTAVRARGAIPFMNWGSWDYSFGPNQPEFSLKNIAQGDVKGFGGQTFDAFLTKWARDAKAWGHPFFLRFDWEMNGWWQFPWGTALNPRTQVSINNNTPADYVAAWRHVHDVFVREGATNVTWVWCPNISGGQTIPMAQLYPGDAYVDWTCLDGYNKDFTHWLTFNKVFGGDKTYGLKNSYAEVTAVAPNKPLMLGEFASDEWGPDNGSGSSKAAWVIDALKTQIPNNFPLIKAILWFNWNSDTNSSYVVESTSVAQQAFADAISLPYYAANTFGTIETSPIQPIGVTQASPTPSVSPSPSTSPSPTISPTPTVSPSPTDSPLPSVSPTPSVSPSPAVCVGDINGDGKVDLLDYSILVSNFMLNPLIDPRADLNGDGKVDLIDYSLLVKNIFTTCP